MMARRTKHMFYLFAGPLMRANGLIYRAMLSPRPGDEVVRVQLGPGQKNYLPGWINVDANTFTCKCDVWADLRNPLPFRDGTVDAFYSHHVIEHLPDLASHFAELFRCLKPGESSVRAARTATPRCGSVWKATPGGSPISPTEGAAWAADSRTSSSAAAST